MIFSFIFLFIFAFVIFSFFLWFGHRFLIRLLSQWGIVLSVRFFLDYENLFCVQRANIVSFGIFRRVLIWIWFLKRQFRINIGQIHTTLASRSIAKVINYVSITIFRKSIFNCFCKIWWFRQILNIIFGLLPCTFEFFFIRSFLVSDINNFLIKFVDLLL